MIVGGRVPGHGRLAGLPGPLLVEEWHEGSWRYGGSVGTGWSDRECTILSALLHVAAVDECPFDEVPGVAGARWVLPRLVGEVRCTTRTRAGRLRHPACVPDSLRTTSRDVRTAQHLLAAAGYTVTADGAFGPHTAGAVKAVRKRHGLKADGVVGRRTAVSVWPTNINGPGTSGRAAQPGGQTRPGGQRHRGTSQPARTS
ncbi:peptidoglycan-binding protein [Streptomyces sp. NPDC058439]|uniref:ATP dependent DNA ligase n=1 Tax=Streptomyces sp. NPDC058439 TaxID=3346500 RepID=UPI0036507F37